MPDEEQRLILLWHPMQLWWQQECKSALLLCVTLQAMASSSHNFWSNPGSTEAAALGQDVSGCWLSKMNWGDRLQLHTGTVPKRFTIAHEIAHFVLHLKRNRRPQLFIDRYMVFRRDGISTAAGDYEEVQANRFDTALLMPARLVRKEVRNHDLDLDDEVARTFLAKRFQERTAE